MGLTLALAGNPNCGKTTLFNAMTGSNQYVGNWPGVTVEKKEGRLKGDKSVTVVDLPGVYSLSPYSPEERVTRDFILHGGPDAVIVILDGTNIERNLYFASQILDLKVPVVLAMNMMDVVNKRGDQIDCPALSRLLGCPVCPISAIRGEGISQLIQTATDTARAKQLPTPAQPFALPSDLPEDPEEAEGEIISARYDYVGELVSQTVKKQPLRMTPSDRIDRIVTNRVLALPIFVAVMFVIYSIAMGGYPFSIGTMGTDWANDVLFGELVPGFFEGILTSLGVSGWLYGLIMDGIVAGMGAVLGFVPQMLVLFFLLAILEDVGYMSRVAFIMDRVFRRFGLSGKSFIPMLVATGCGVPGIMASRTIEQERDRRMTIMTTGFIPCSAKMPIIGLFAGAIFGASPWVATSAFFFGIAAVVLSGVILKKFKAFAGDPAPFVMELPTYHLPTPSNILRATWERGWSFIKRAGTVILLSSILLWFLQGYGFVDGVFQAVEDNNDSLLAAIGGAIAWIFYPLGWAGDMAWKATVATLTGLIAKEEVVNTFGVLYHYAGDADLLEDSSAIWTMVGADFGAVTAYSFMVFNLLCAPCFAAMGAIRREMSSPKWTAAAIGYMCLFAYAVSMMIYQLGGLITGEATFGPLTVVAAALLVGMLWLLFRKGYTPAEHRRLAAEPAAA